MIRISPEPGHKGSFLHTVLRFLFNDLAERRVAITKAFMCPVSANIVQHLAVIIKKRSMQEVSTEFFGDQILYVIEEVYFSGALHSSRFRRIFTEKSTNYVL